MVLGDLFYRLSTLQRILLIVGACSIIFLLYYLIVLSSFQFEPVSREMKNLGKDIATEEAKLKKAEEIETSIESQKAILKDLVESLPEKHDFEATSKQIDRLASEIGVKILKFAPAPESLSKEYSFAKIPFLLSLYAEYKKLGMFFHKLDQLPRLVHIEVLVLNPREGKAIKKFHTLPLDANVTLVTYRRMSDEEVQASSQKNPTESTPKR